MKIKATIVFLLLSVLLIGKSDKVVARLHSNVQLVQHATAVDNTFSICEKSALKYAEVNVCNWQVTADVFPDYYPSDEEDDSIDNSVFHKLHNVFSFLDTQTYHCFFQPDVNALSGNYAPKKYILYRVFII